MMRNILILIACVLFSFQVSVQKAGNFNGIDMNSDGAEGSFSSAASANDLEVN